MYTWEQLESLLTGGRAEKNGETMETTWKSTWSQSIECLHFGDAEPKVLAKPAEAQDHKEYLNWVVEVGWFQLNIGCAPYHHSIKWLPYWEFYLAF